MKIYKPFGQISCRLIEIGDESFLPEKFNGTSLPLTFKPVSKESKLAFVRSIHLLGLTKEKKYVKYILDKV